MQPASSVVVIEGDHFMLHCEAYSIGSLTTHQLWQRESSTAQGDETTVDILKGDERVMVFNREGVLLVSEARLGQDSGTYSCVATNIYGTSKTSTHVTVLSKLVGKINICWTITN